MLIVGLLVAWILAGVVVGLAFGWYFRHRRHIDPPARY
jgi:hypothetical protein